jgi:hypothetical protein
MDPGGQARNARLIRCANRGPPPGCPRLSTTRQPCQDLNGRHPTNPHASGQERFYRRMPIGGFGRGVPFRCCGTLRLRACRVLDASNSSSMAAFDRTNRTGFSPVPREERGRPPRSGGSLPRRAGSAHGVRRDDRIRRRILGRRSHILRRRREARRHQRQSGASRCARSSCRCRRSRDRGVCSGPIPPRRVRQGPHLHSSCNCQHSPSTR